MDFELRRLNRIRKALGARRRRKEWFVLGGIFFMILLPVFYFTSSSETPLLPGAPATSGSQPQEPPHQVIEGSVEEKSSLFKSLTEKQIPAHWIELIVSKLKPHVNFKKIKGGTYRFITDVQGRLVKFIFEAGPTEIYEIEEDSQGYTAQRKEVFLDSYLTKVEGEIRSSLFEAVEKTGEGDQLVIAFAEILAWEIDFYKDVREGDRFKIVVEKVYKGDRFIQYGPIHGLEYLTGEKRIRGIRYGEAYYNEDGASLKKAFLKAPLRFSRISSRFSLGRKHPILGGIRPHLGLDYAAPVGTPIRAVGDGAVVSCCWNGGFGKQVVLRHPNGYMTYYGHLSRYGAGIRKGIRVTQKQIIGYVGSTGLSTGPHLDYRMVKGGRFRNPLRESFPAGLQLEQTETERFQKKRDQIVAWLQTDHLRPVKIERDEAFAPGDPGNGMDR
jgi:murein DD-endopeptidase MepM/ murein hydrolase activator NlpD